MASISEPVLSLQNIVKSFGAQPILDDVSLTIHATDRIGLIGRNGTGKSTLLKVMCGRETPTSGLVTTKQGLKVVLLDQQTTAEAGKTVGDVLEAVTHEDRARMREYHRLTRLMAQPETAPSERDQAAQRAAALEQTLTVGGGWNVDQEVKRVRVGLDLPAGDRPLATLSGGELRRLALAAAVVQHPDVLLLDEPTNHIDVASVSWIEEFIAGYRGACVLVTHDRYFLDRVVNRIVELERNSLTSYPGKYEEFLARKAARNEAEARAETGRQAVIRRELAWLRRGPKARGTKQKARKDRFEELAQAGPVREEREFAFEIPYPRRLSKRILEAEAVSLAVGGQTLFKDVNLMVTKSMRVGVVGPNGCGKTTLLRVLMGLQKPDTGSVFVGESTQFLYVDQRHEEAHPEKTVLEHVTNGARDIDINGRRVHAPSYLECFLFDRRSIEMPMGNLSGGERNRIDLARKLLQGGNFLVLDEPTNDLDLATLRVLEEAVLDFDGPALLVSHDRYFLNRLCTDMLVFEDGGRVVHIAGNYDDYLIYREKIDAESAPAAGNEPDKTTRRPRTPKSGARKLTWHEKRELEGMETAIQEAESELERLEEQLMAPGFYEGGPETVQETLKAHETAKNHVETLYNRWAELDAVAEGTAAGASEA